MSHAAELMAGCAAPRLTHLTVAMAPVGDDGLAAIAALSSLQVRLKPWDLGVQLGAAAGPSACRRRFLRPAITQRDPHIYPGLYSPR